MAGYVYLIGSPTFGWYKIGKSATPDIRIKDIGILLPFKVAVFAIWKAENHHLLETVLHEKYAQFNINGEWFRFERDKIAAIVLWDLPDVARIFPTENTLDSVFATFSNMSRDNYHLDTAPMTPLKPGKPKPPMTAEYRERRKQEAISSRRRKRAEKQLSDPHLLS